MKFHYPEILSIDRNIPESIDNQSSGYNKIIYMMCIYMCVCYK